MTCVTVESKIVHVGASQMVTIPYSARSISLTVKTGSVTVAIAAGIPVVVSAGLSHTWAVDGPDEILTEEFVFTGDASADAYVTVTRE